MAMLMTSVLTTSVFAELKFNDVDENTAYSEAIYDLVGEGIINGYDNGDGTSSFKPDATITRAEFAKIVVMTKEGATAAFNQTTTNFPDMAGSEWAIPYVAHAAGLGIINGYEDGTFRPEATVTYAEVVKMIVCALGYGPVVDTTLDPWYTGYIDMANRIGVTKGTGSLPDNGAPRGMVAQLCDNMLSTDRLVQTGTDANGKPTYSTSKGDIIGSDDDVTESDGVVTAIFDNSLRGSDDALTKSQIKIDDTIYTLSDSLKNNDMTQYLGRPVTFKYTGSSKYTVTTIRVSGKYETLDITDELFDSATLGSISYYADPDSDTRKSTANLDNNLYIVYNGVGVPKSQINAALLQLTDGTIRLVNNDNDSAYDIAYVDSYVTYYANAPVTNNGVTTIYDKSGFAETININEDDAVVSRVSSAGGKSADAKLSAVVNKAVVSVAKPLNQTSGTKVMVSTATVSGSVSGLADGYDKVTVSNKEYKASPYFKKLMSEKGGTYKFDIGTSVKFYLDYWGRIAFVDVNATSDPYGYLIGYSSTSGVDSQYQVRIMNTSSKWTTYTLNDSVRVNGSSCKPSKVIELLNSAFGDITGNKAKDYKDKIGKMTPQVVKYKANSSNKITDLTIVGSDGIVPYAFTTDDTAKEPYSDYTSKLTYAKSGYAFKDSNKTTQFNMNSSTVVFVVPIDPTSETDYKKVSYTTFTDGEGYIVEPYDVPNGSTTAKVVVYYRKSGGSLNNVGAGTNAAVIIGRKSVTHNDHSSYELTVRKFGDAEDTVVYTEDLDQIKGYNNGDIIRYTTTDDNEIDDIEKQFNIENKKLEKATDGDYVRKIEYDKKAGYYTAVYGTVYSIDINDNGSGSVGIMPGDYSEGANYDTYTVKDKTPYYMYDTSGRDAQLVEKTYGSLIAALDNPETATKVVLIMIDNSVKGIYILE